jgi:choline-sulfatase
VSLSESPVRAHEEHDVSRILLSLACVLVAAGGASHRASDGASRRPTGVLLVTLDTARADRLSPYGFVGARMPHLERLASEGVLFEQAFSVAPLTLPAHVSLFTGLLPPSHAVRDNADEPLSPAHSTLAERLQSRGFKTGAFVGSVVLQSDRGLAQGFDTYRDVSSQPGAPPARQRPGNFVVDEAIEWLEGTKGAPFLLWAHLYDPHTPYDPPDPYRRAHADPYVGELLFADAQLGRLLDGLDRLRLADRTVVVVAGDHGEGLGDHGETTHGLLVYDSVLRVPLIVRAPAIRPRRIADVVRLIDIAPTVLELLGLDGPQSDGISLVRALKGGRLDVEAYAESLYPARMGLAPVLALRDRRFKLIDGPTPELYDLEQDPFEQNNVIGARGRIADAMRARLRTIVGPGAADANAVLNKEVPQDLRERLAALGYVMNQRQRQPREAIRNRYCARESVGEFPEVYDSHPCVWKLAGNWR